MNTRKPATQYEREYIITAPARELDIIETAARQNPARAESFFSCPEFHGAPEIKDFPTLRKALAQGIPAKTAAISAALKTIAEKQTGLKLRHTDEPARIVDISAYLQGVPECYYKPQAQNKPYYKLIIFNSFPCCVPACCIANRAAAIVALAKQMKAAGAGVSAEIVFRTKPTGRKISLPNVQTSFPVNLDALNIGKFAFMTSPAFYRTYIFAQLETQYNNWKNKTPIVESAISPCGIPNHLRQINFPDGYQNFLHGGGSKTEAARINTAHNETLYGTPDDAFETIRRQFNENIERIKNLKQ